MIAGAAAALVSVAVSDAPDIARAVSAVVNDCLGVRDGENVLVVANPATLGLGERLRGEAGRAGADAVLALMAERASHAGEPPAPVAAAMRAADVVLAPTIQSLSHTAFTQGSLGGGCADRHPSRRHRGAASPPDER